MSNGARHGLGVLVGLVVTPIIAVCMMYGADELGRAVRTFAFEGNGQWIGAGLFVIAAILLGLVAGSRLSPLASLIPGAVFAVVGLLWIVDPRWMLQNTGRDLLPRELWMGYTTFAAYGIFLLLGVALLVASMAPSRWRAARPAAPAAGYGAPPAPMGPPMHGAPAHMGPPPAPHAPHQGPPQWQGAPQYGQPPAQPGQGNPPPLPSAPPAPPAAPPADDKPASAPQSGSDRNDPDDDEPGEWTKVYGGGNR